MNLVMTISAYHNCFPVSSHHKNCPRWWVLAPFVPLPNVSQFVNMMDFDVSIGLTEFTSIGEQSLY